MNFIKRFPGLTIFLLLAAIVTLITLTVYAVGQQIYRQNANDPQIEAARAVEKLMNEGLPADAITGQGPSVDMKNDLSLFVMILDKDKKVVSSSGQLGESTPTPPGEAFDSLGSNNENRFTWQPENGVRVASVVRKLSEDKGYVLVGRNMQEVERRIVDLNKVAGIAWPLLLLLSGLLSWMIAKLLRPQTVIEETEIIAVTPPTENQ